MRIRMLESRVVYGIALTRGDYADVDNEIGQRMIDLNVAVLVIDGLEETRGAPVRSGNLIGEDGKLHNMYDLLGGVVEPESDIVYNAELYPAQTGRIIGPDGKVYNLVNLLRRAGVAAGQIERLDEQIESSVLALTQIETARRDSIAAAKEARDGGVQAVQIAQGAADAVHAQIDRADADIRAQIDTLDEQTRAQADTVEAEVRAQAQAAVDDLAATALRTSASKYDFVAPQGNPVQVRAARKSTAVVESSADCEVAVGGKNLFGLTDATYSSSNSRGAEADIITDNEILLTRTSLETSSFIQAVFIVNPALCKWAGQRFTLSANLDQHGYTGEAYVLISQYDASGVSWPGVSVGISSRKKVFTIYNNCAKIYIIFRMEQNTATPVPEGATLRISDIQIEAGDTATTFAPFAGLTTAPLTANTPTEIQAPDSDVTTILATAGQLTVRYNRESMDTLKAITCETSDEGTVATIHPVQDAPVHVQARYTAKQHFDWVQALGESSQVKTTGKNLLPVSDIDGVMNGITKTVNADGSITIKGTATARAFVRIAIQGNGVRLPAGQYTLGFGVPIQTGCIASLGHYDNNTVYISNLVTLASGLKHKSFNLTEMTGNIDGIYDVPAGTTVDTTIYPQLEIGDVATSYEPYSGGHASPSPDWPQPITSNVPAGGYYVPSTGPASGYWRLDIDEDLGGVGDYQDAVEIDEYTGRYRVGRKTAVIVLNGTEAWDIYGDNAFGFGMNGSLESIGVQGFSSHYPWIYSRPGAGMYVTANIVILGGGAAAEYTSLAEWKAYLAAQHAAGTPVTIRYALATPTITTGQATRVGNSSNLAALPVESMGLTAPDPDHPCEIAGVEVARVGTSSKNLLRGTERFEVNDEVSNLAGTISNTDLFNGCYTLKTGRAWEGYKINFKAIAKRIGIKVGDVLTYSIWAKTDGVPIKNSDYSIYSTPDVNGLHSVILRFTPATAQTWTQIKHTFEVSKEILEVMSLRIESNYGENPDYTTTTANVIFAAPQLEFGDTATPHEPHRGATQTATLPAPLYGLPDAPATYDSDGWTEDGTACVVYNGSEPWKDYRPAENTETYFGFQSVLPLPNHIDYSRVWSNYLKFGAASTQGYFPNTILPHTNGNVYVRVEIPGVNSVDTWRAYLAEHPLQILYHIAPTRLAAPPMHLGGVNPDCHVYGNADSVKADAIEDPKWAKEQISARQSATEDTALANSEKLADIAPADKIAVNYIPGLLVHRWGVEIPADGNPACKRLYEAEGMVANAHKGSYNASLRNDFDDVFLMKGRKRLNYDLAGKRILAYEGDAAFKVDGSNGDVFVRQPAHWRKREVLADGREIRAFADGALAGYEYVPERLIGSFMASAADAASASNNGTGTMRSICGAEVTPLTSVSLQNFLAKAKNSKCTLLDMDTYADQADMMLIEFANRNIQAMIGNGVASNYYNNTTRPLISETGANRVVIEKARAVNIVAGWNTICISTVEYNFNKAAYRLVTAVNALNDTQSEVVFAGAPVDVLTTDYVCVTKNRLGQSEGILTGSGYIGINGKSSVKYRGAEDVFGHVFQGLLGVLKLGSHPPVYYYCDEPAKYAMSVTEDYREIGRCNIDAEGYVKTVLHNETAPFASSLIADQVGANTVTYWCDYVYRNTKPDVEETTRLRVPFAGGNWASGSSDGPWCLRWYYAPSWAYWYCGSRLLVIPPWGVRGA